MTATRTRRTSRKSQVRLVKKYRRVFGGEVHRYQDANGETADIPVRAGRGERNLTRAETRKAATEQLRPKRRRQRGDLRFPWARIILLMVTAAAGWLARRAYGAEGEFVVSALFALAMSPFLFRRLPPRGRRR